MHIENLLFILLIAMAVLFRLLATKVGETKERSHDADQRPAASRPPVEPIRRAPAESDAERIRKFLEALGQPTDTRPPPPVLPRTYIPPRPLAPVKPPIARVWEITREELRKRKAILKETPPPEAAERAEKVFPPPTTSAPAFDVHDGPLAPEPPPIIETPVKASAVTAEPKTKVVRTDKDIATLLHSSAGQRNAIILREIFGPPRSLQSFDLLGSA